MKNALASLLFLVVLSITNVSGQQVGESANQAGNLSLRIKSLNFIEDNEFFNPIVEGYTLLGFFLQPELIYSPAPKVSLSGGIHILKYYGTEKFSQIRPVFSTTVHFTDKTTLTLGTLSGPDKHHFFDPHFYDERLYNQYVEDGIQLTHINDHIFTDTWISWENFIVRGDSTREQFTFGESFRYTSSPIADFIHIEVPVQLQLKHRGGQISDYPEKMESFINLAGGLTAKFDLANKKYGQAGIEYLYFVNKLRAGDSISGLSQGRASWVRMFYSYKIFKLETGYWRAHDYYAPNGNPIYGSVSNYQPNLVLHDRRIITSTASVRYSPISSLELYFGIDLFYDIDLQRIDQTYLLHLNFDKLINLAFRRKNQELHN